MPMITVADDAPHVLRLPGAYIIYIDRQNSQMTLDYIWAF